MTHPLLTRSDIDAFQRDGVVLIKGLFRSHVEALRKGVSFLRTDRTIKPWD